MMNEPENDFARKYAGVRHRGAESVSGSRPAARGMTGISRPHNFSNPATFSGLFTNNILTALPGEDFARLLHYLQPVSLSCGENLYGVGDDVQDVFFPENSVVSQLHILEDGSTTEAALIGREGIIGLSAVFDAHAPTYLTQVTIGGSALRMSAEVLKQEFARGGAMQKLLLAYAAKRLVQLSQKAVCNARHTVLERLCNWLMMIHDRVGNHQLPLTHEQIADHLGARRAGITEAASSLRDRGLISYTRGQVRIVDRRAMEAATCECYQILGQQNLVTAKS